MLLGHPKISLDNVKEFGAHKEVLHYGWKKMHCSGRTGISLDNVAPCAVLYNYHAIDTRTNILMESDRMSVDNIGSSPIHNRYYISDE